MASRPWHDPAALDGDCGLRVGGETRRWTGCDRIVLIIDIRAPDLSPKEVGFLEGLHRFGAFQAQA